MGEKITVEAGVLRVPENPIIPFIEGDGIGPDIWKATKMVLDEAVYRAYGQERRIAWLEVLAGQKGLEHAGSLLPDETLDAIRIHLVALKGPLGTPVGSGFRSLNVAIRQILDLYACVRPVRWYRGVPSPVKNPEQVNLVIFRENTEDVYAGIEWKKGSPEVLKLISFLRQELGVEVTEDSGLGIKPISERASKRLVRAAIRYAVENGRRSVTLVHKGNIMKFTEGAFCEWGYQLAREEFRNAVITEEELWRDHAGVLPEGAVVIKDRIADNMLQQLLTRTSDYDVLALPNLNGDYLSDAAAAQVGGLGMAPGANFGDTIAVFEATHGSAPKYAGQDKANPSSLILSGVMLLEHIGWKEAAALVVNSLEMTIEERRVTYDLARNMEGAQELKTSEFAEALVSNMAKVS